MSSKPTLFTDELYDFTVGNAIAESDVLHRLRMETAAHPMSVMQISPVQGAFMSLLASAIGAKRALEIGTFTGYSSIALAEGMGEGGYVLTCDISDEYTAIARRYWADAGLADRIELRLGDAVGTLDGLIEDGQSGTFDIAFIDADKEQYSAYYERSLVLVKQGGLILFDNMFMDGRVSETMNDESDVSAIRGLYPILRNDDRVQFSVIPVADGLGLALKR